jgi:NADH oxidase (H2O2-forming)
MKNADVIVIGGSAAGLTAAITSRRHYPEKSVMVIRKEKHVLIPCGIPYIFGTLGDTSKNLIPDETLAKNNIELMIDEVVGINTDSKIITTKKGAKSKYERLIIATGSEPVTPPIPGSEKSGVYMIKKDVQYLQDMMKALEVAKNVVVIGSGFIGVELAEECKRGRDVNVTILARSNRCLRTPYDPDFSAEAEGCLKEEGIEILTHETAERFIGVESVERVKLTSGKEIPADIVIFGIGCTANTELAVMAGLTLGPTKGIAVNRYMQTSDPNVFACGDCAEKVSFFDGQPSKLKLASIATTEARIAASNLFETRRVNDGVIGVYSTMLNDNAFSGAGLTENEAKKLGYDIIIGEAKSPNRHPGGMKGMAQLKVKLIFEKGTQILLGGQASGAKSAGELINAISACILHKMTADDIAQFQTGTHPGLTASPIAYQLVNAAEMAIINGRNTSAS